MNIVVVGNITECLENLLQTFGSALQDGVRSVVGSAKVVFDRSRCPSAVAPP